MEGAGAFDGFVVCVVRCPSVAVPRFASDVVGVVEDDGEELEGVDAAGVDGDGVVVEGDEGDGLDEV